MLQKNVLKEHPEKVEFVVDFHLRPYYGNEDKTDGLYGNEAKNGTPSIHGYATLYARVRNKRYPLAVRRVIDGDTASEGVVEFLGIPDNFDIDSKTVNLNHEFYDGKILTLLHTHDMASPCP